MAKEVSQELFSVEMSKGTISTLRAVLIRCRLEVGCATYRVVMNVLFRSGVIGQRARQRVLETLVHKLEDATSSLLASLVAMAMLISPKHAIVPQTYPVTILCTIFELAAGGRVTVQL